MSKILAKDIFKDNLSTRSYVEPILNSPYSTVYEKPLRIMKIDSNGDESIEVTRTTYKTINDAVSLDKLTEICDHLVSEKMVGKEKSLMSQLVFSLGEQVLEIEKRLLSSVDWNIDQKVKEKHFDNLEKELFQRLDYVLSDKMSLIFGKIMDDIDSRLESQTDFILNQIKEEIRKEMGGAQSDLKKLVEKEVKDAMDNMTESDMVEDEGCEDVLCDLPELETIKQEDLIQECKEIVQEIQQQEDNVHHQNQDLDDDELPELETVEIEMNVEQVFDLSANKKEAVEAEVARVEEAVESEVARVEEAVESEVARVDEAVESEVVRVEEAVEAEVVRVEEAVEAEVVRVEEAVEDEVARVEEAVESEVARVEEAVESEVARVEEAVVQEVEKVEEAVESEVARVEEAVESEVAKVEEAVVQEVEKVEEAVEDEVARVEEAVESEVAKVEEAVEDEVAKVEEGLVEEAVESEVAKIEEAVVQEVETIEEAVESEVAKVEDNNKLLEESEKMDTIVLQDEIQIPKEESVVKRIPPKLKKSPKNKLTNKKKK